MNDALPPMLSVEDALSLVLSLCAPLANEVVPVDEAIGRTLARDVLARRTLPPWDNSAVDGYAVRSADLAAGPTRLQIVDTLYAGMTPGRPIGPGQCARIMTGAPLPEGADAIVMQEKTRRSNSLHRSPTGSGLPEVEILEPVGQRAFVRDRGEDARRGERLLPRGVPIGVPEAALLWAQGMTGVRVGKKPRVAIASTGDELCAVDEKPAGRIVDTNSPALAAAVRRGGGLPVPLGLCRDDLGAVKALLRGGLTHDVLITSAGVSVGERDFTRDALGQLGVELSFWRVAIKPGKPLAVGRRGKTIVFGLPGNPTSSLVSFELFVRPCLRRLLGFQDVAPARVRGRIEVGFKKAKGLTHFVRVVTRWKDGELLARPLASQTSGALRSAAAATHLMLVPAEAAELEPLAPVELLPVSWTA